MVISVIEWMNELFEKFGQALMSVLPRSPFADFIASMDTGSWAQGLKWLNWFLPIGRFMVILLAWVTAYGIYLLYRIILRWIKAVA